MSIKIFSKKTLKSYPYFQRLNLIDYSNNLTSTAKIQKGFINSHSYWLTPINYKNNELIIITVSTWKNFQSWNDWYFSEDRKKIYKDHKNIIEKEEFSILKNKLTNDDVFLL